MSHAEETIAATLDSNGQLQLEHPPKMQPGPVQVTIRPAAPCKPKYGLADVLREIHAGQVARGYQGLSSEDLQRLQDEAAAEDAAYDSEMDQAFGRPPTCG